MGGTGQRADGTLVYVDSNSDATYELIACVKSLTPPGRVKEDIEDTCLADTLRYNVAGIEEISEMAFTRNYDPTGTIDAALDTLYANQTKVNWKIVYPFTSGAGAGTKEWIFQGRLKGIVPSEVANGVTIQQQYTVERTGAITIQDTP